jgi:hypothetical protein
MRAFFPVPECLLRGKKLKLIWNARNLPIRITRGRYCPRDQIAPMCATERLRSGWSNVDVNAATAIRHIRLTGHGSPPVECQTDDEPKGRLAAASDTKFLASAVDLAPGASNTLNRSASSQLLATGGVLWAQGLAFSKAAAPRKMSVSQLIFATICKPTGKPPEVNPTGIDAAGWPVRLKGYV